MDKPDIRTTHPKTAQRLEALLGDIATYAGVCERLAFSINQDERGFIIASLLQRIGWLADKAGLEVSPDADMVRGDAVAWMLPGHN